MTKDPVSVSDEIRAEVVYAGIGAPALPTPSKEPREDQLQGTPLENLVEISGRICYDSLGTGRSSEEFHKHLLEVGHRSVHEHARTNCVLEFGNHYAMRDGMALMCNIKDARAYPIPGRPLAMAVSVNLRHILEWEENTKWTRFFDEPGDLHDLSISMGDTLRTVAHSVAPMIISAPDSVPSPASAPVKARTVFEYAPYLRECSDFRDKILVPETTHISVYLSGSRLFSHEQVRHRMSMSQRSTRFVDEADSPVLLHPIVENYASEWLVQRVREHIDEGRALYRELCDDVRASLPTTIDATTARKAARGAARMVLESSLPTEMIFTASIADWKLMCNQRCKDWADAEIRAVFNRVLSALVAHPHTARYFEKAKVIKAENKIGFSLAEDLK